MNKHYEFSISLLFFWIKGQLSIDKRLVKVSTSNVIFGLFPAGTDAQNIPLKNISSTQLSSKYSVFRMLIGAVIILFALASIGNSFFSALIFILIGGLVFGSGMLTSLTIQKAGRDFTIIVPFYEKQKVMKIQDDIEEALMYDADKGDLNRFFDER
ncbi:hypothetical protein [Staphylococcus sp. 11261D007BR]